MSENPAKTVRAETFPAVALPLNLDMGCILFTPLSFLNSFPFAPSAHPEQRTSEVLLHAFVSFLAVCRGTDQSVPPSFD